MTNESAILGLLAELYRDRAALQVELGRLRAEVAALNEQSAKQPSGTDPS